MAEPLARGMQRHGSRCILEVLASLRQQLARMGTKDGMMAAQPIELVYVGYRSEELRQVLDAGVRTFLVDREWRGKERRQLGQDTEIDAASREDLAAATALPGARVWCRINSFGNQTPQEVEEAIEVGVDCVFLPMVRTIEEVRGFLALVAGRCKTAMRSRRCSTLAAARRREPGRRGLRSRTRCWATAKIDWTTMATVVLSVLNPIASSQACASSRHVMNCHATAVVFL